MRAFWILLVAVLVAIGIGVGIEAGNVVTGPKPVLKAAIASLSSSPTVEMSLSLADSPAIDQGSSAAERGEITSARVTLDEASADGHSLLSSDTAPSSIDEQIGFADEGSDLADVRIVAGTHFYFRIFPGAMAKLPGVSATDRQQLADVGDLIGGSWFTLPSSFSNIINKAVANARAGKASADTPAISPAESKAATQKFESDLLAVMRFESTGAPGGGTAVTATAPLGKLASAALNDFLPLFDKALASEPNGSLVRNAIGQEEQSAKKSVSTVTGSAGVLVVTAPDNRTMRNAALTITSQGQSLTMRAAVRHDPISIGTPSGVRQLPKSILNQLGPLTNLAGPSGPSID